MKDTLAGAVVVGLLVGDSPWGTESTVYLDLGDRGIFVLDTEGDCCSETWFADITGVGSLLGGIVTGMEAIDMPEDENAQDDRGRQEYDRFYGIRITTDKGTTDLIFRNSSNGYYGGSANYRVLDGPDEAFNAATLITADWSA